MALAAFSVRMDDKLKAQFEELCESFGMNMTTAINVFARAVVRERKIPFEISEGKNEVTREGALLAFKALREQAVSNGISEMSLDEINEEIRMSREGK